MNFKQTLLASASALVLLGAGASGAMAEELEQNLNGAGDIVADAPANMTLNQTVTGTGGTVASPDTSDAGSRRVNTVTGGYSDMLLGISHDQQNNGSNNAIGIASNVILNTTTVDDDIEQDLWLRGATHDGGYVDAVAAANDDAIRTNTISNAYKGAKGIVDVQQNNGDGNVMGIGDVVSATFGPVGVGTDAHRDSEQSVLVSGSSTSNVTHDSNFVSGGPTISGERTNTINSGAFQSFVGMASVQQNNGNANVVQAGNAVVADVLAAAGASEDDEAEIDVAATANVANNDSGSTSDGGPPPPNDRTNSINNAFTDGVGGIINVQQNNGDNNVMGVANGVRVVYVGADDTDDVQNASAAVSQATVSTNTSLGGDQAQNRRNDVNGTSFDGAAGLISVQQNNGDNNAINSAAAVVANLFENGIADSVHLGAKATANVVNNVALATSAVDRVNSVNNAFNDGAAGIVTVQQNNGDNNAINASKAVAAVIGDGTAVGFNGDVVADTALVATVTGNTATIESTAVPPGYENTLTNAFVGYSGIKTVQQNNGSNNAIQSVVTVVANGNF